MVSGELILNDNLYLIYRMRNKNDRNSVFKWIYSVSDIFHRWKLSIDIKDTTIYIVYVMNDYVLSIEKDVSKRTRNEISHIISDILVDIYYNYERTGNIVNYKNIWLLLNIWDNYNVSHYLESIKRKMYVKSVYTNLLYIKS